MNFDYLNPLILFPSLVLFCCVYYLIPRKYRWLLLLIASYAFFFFVGGWTILILVLCTIINYLSGIGLQITKHKRLLLISSIIINISILVFFKYFVSYLSSDSLLYKAFLSGAGTIIFPVGLSFYTLQNISYLLDISNGLISAEKNPGVFAVYLAFFPKIIAGPIERGKTLIPQLRDPEALEKNNLIEGLRLILVGLFYKLVIADCLVLFVNEVFSKPGYYEGVTIIVGLIFLSFQIYLDFAGYTSIARGVAKLLGINLTENFNHPYLSENIMEFWNRWHISFSSWLRDYIFYPLRFILLRKKLFNSELPALILPPLITMVISGLWHGTGLTFFFWGLYHAFFYTITVVIKNRSGKAGKNTKLLAKIGKIIFNFGVLTGGWLIFRSDSMQTVWMIFKNIFIKRIILDKIFKVTYEVDYRLSWLMIIIVIISEILMEVWPKRFAYKNLPFAIKAIAIGFMALCLTIFGIYQAGGSTFVYGKF